MPNNLEIDIIDKQRIEFTKKVDEELVSTYSALLIEAGNVAIDLLDKKSKPTIEGPHDIQTSADVGVGKFIRERLKEISDLPVLEEESFKKGEQITGKTYWIVDPIDGSTGAERGLSDWAITLALCEHGDIRFSMIYLPQQRELYYAIKGKGAYKIENSVHTPVKVSSRRDITNAVVWTDQRVVRTQGKGIHGEQRLIDVVSLMNIYQTIWVAPSPSIALARLAEGTIDGFVQMQKPAWDFAAGALLVKEAGGKVTNWKEDPNGFDLTGADNNYIIASNGPLHNALLTFILPDRQSVEIQEKTPARTYNVFVFGTGAVYEEKVQKALDYLGPSSQRILVDLDRLRLQDAAANGAIKVNADAIEPPFRLAPERAKTSIAFIATPEHFQAIEMLVKIGFRNFIVEKPLVNNGTEIKKLQRLLKQYPDLKVYPMDFYIQKLAMLQVLTGKIKPDDPRWSWVEMSDGSPVSNELSGSLSEHIGQLEGISVTILEGGNFGLPDLKKRPWLEKDKKRGGMLLDLGTHSLAPLGAAGLVHAEDVQVHTATRYVLNDTHDNFVPTTNRANPEIYADALLSIQNGDTRIPLKVTVGKIFLGGGIWELVMKGSNGNLAMGLRTGDHLTIQPKGGNDIQLQLKPGMDPYALAFQEADMFFRGELSSNAILQPMLDAIRVISTIKSTSNRK